MTKKLLIISFFAGASLLFLSILSSANLQAQSTVQAYQTDEPLQKGIIVKLKGSDGTAVEPLLASDVRDMHGVVVAANDAPVTLSDETDATKAYIATSGRYEVIVSDQNGLIAPGDYISISSLEGVGMLAGKDEALVLGKAVTAFAGANDATSTTTLKQGDGEEHKVNLGRITVDISVATNPNFRQPESILPGFVRHFAESVAGKPVSDMRIYLGLAILVGTITIAGSLLYSGVKTGMIAIGRNPLAKKSIRTGLLQVTLTSLIVFIIGIFGVYLLLRL